MFMDASAIVAIITREPGWEHIMRRLEDHPGSMTVSPIARFEAIYGVARKRLEHRSITRTAGTALAMSAAVVDEFIDALEARKSPSREKSAQPPSRRL